MTTKYADRIGFKDFGALELVGGTPKLTDVQVSARR